MKFRPLFLLPLIVQQVFAAPITWDQPNANNNWNTTDANWTGGATFANGDDAIFNAATGETVTVVAGGVTPTSTTISGNGAWTFTGGSILGGTLAKSGTGALILSNTGGNSFSGITLTGSGAGTGLFGSTNGSLRFANGNVLGSGTIDFSAVSNVSTGFYATATTTVTNAVVLPTSFGWGITHLTGNTTTFSGVISGGAATNRVTLGAGTIANPTSVTLLTNASNSFKGEIYLGRGVLAITSNGALGDAANVINMDHGSSNGQLRFDANNIDVTHKIQQRATTSYNVNGFDATLSGEISLAGGTSVKGGTNTLGTSAGTLTVTGSNISTSAYTIAADTKFIAASVNGLGGGTKTVSAGGTVAFKNVGTYTSAGQINLNGSGTQVASVGVGALENIAGNNVFNNVVNLQSNSTIGVTAGSLTLGTGVTGGAVSLTKIGNGTLTLNGASNTYTGTTTVSAGTLLINGSLASTAATTVDTTATIGGNTTFNGAVTVNGNLSPGNSPGQMDFNGQNLTLGSASTTTMELGGTTRGTGASNYDSLIDIGTITLDGTWTVSLVNAFSPAVSNMFDLFDATTVDASGFNVGSDLVLPTLSGGLSWDTSGFTTSGQIVVVPEPSAVLLGSFGVLVLLRRRRG
jgi:autotransporter-associated beta strand protein